MKIVNPANGHIITQVETTEKDAIATSFSKAKAAGPLWAELSVDERLAIIVKFGALVQADTDRLAGILTSETGKPLQQSLNEIRGAHGRIEHLQANAAKWLASEVMTEGDTREEIHYDPLGVIVNISAWNFPYNVGFNVFLYALVAGNAVLYKPSEFATLTGLEFEKMLHEAGVPNDVFKCVVGGGEAGAALLDLPADGYFFTGSHRTGKKIAEKVAGKLVPVQLELGGKDPLYVADDVADVKQAAVNAAEGAFYNNGQSCCAVERIYVHSDIYDEFVTAFVEEVKSYKMGDPNSLETFVGPLTREPQIDVILDQIEEARAAGCEVLCGGNRIDLPGNWLEPTVVVGPLSNKLKIMRDESFGPVIGIQKVGSDEEAAACMADTDYGLTAAVFSASEGRAKSILSKMNTGTVYWNCCDRVSPNVPWSGRGNSGLGSTLSYQGIRAFVQPKAWHLRP